MEPFRQGKERFAFRRALAVVALLAAWCLVPASASGTEADHGEGQARVFTDGRLHPGHLETIRVEGFPGRGRTEVAFFPTAICGNGCAAAGRRGDRTNSSGDARFAVRVPGTFMTPSGKHVYFRDGERISLQVVWTGPGKSFDVVEVNPEPFIVRTHGSRHA